MQSGGNKLRLLVVDDEPDIRLMLSLFFQNAGHDVVAMPSAPEALRAAQNDRFDAVIADIGMPMMDGYELARALREVSGYATVPLIAVTGFVEYSNRERALEAGFNERLSKPINLSALLKLIASLGASGRSREN
ncbi:MAG: response regulator [Pyrinomonadaceae bacterium]